MKKYWVYVHTCPNGKKYVGITTQTKPEYRWLEGRGYKGQLFEEVIRKYGWDNIEHEVFEVDSAEEMYRKEIELISFYHSNDPKFGYNNSAGGECSHLGCRHSEETRKKMSQAQKKVQKKVHSDPEYRRKLSRPHKPFSEETKRKMSETAKNRPRIKISLPDGTVLEMTKHNLVRNYVNKGRKFEYVS